MWAHSNMSDRIAQAAIAQPAELYIAHCLAALPAVAIASQKHNAKFSFDAEDFHLGELAKIPENKLEIAIRDYIERTLLPQCCYLTAASPMIAEAYRNRYGVNIEPILNVFPLAEAPVKLKEVKNKESFSLYWFSQTIGGDRGIESIVEAMAQMRTSVDLYLRGRSAVGYTDILTQLADQLGVGDRIHILPSAAPNDMAQLAFGYDIGLCIELNQPFNRAICLTNKIFTYLLAGLPILMSDTPAQKELALQLGEAALVVNIYDPKSLAMILDAWFADSLELEKSRTKAWDLGREVYNWDIEQQIFSCCK